MPEHDTISAMRDKLILTEAKAKAAHERIDKVEERTQGSLKEIRDGIKDIEGSLTELEKQLSYNRGRDRAIISILAFLGSVLGIVITSLLPQLIK